MFIEMEEAKVGMEKPRALLVYTKSEMPVGCFRGDTEQAMRYRDWSSGERSVRSTRDILNSRVISM